MNPKLTETIKELLATENLVKSEHRPALRKLTEYISSRKEAAEPCQLNFICTHNSRRSQISQLWALAAARYFNLNNFHAFSGGTEATAFNYRAVDALSSCGFELIVKREGDNPIYTWLEQPEVELYSTLYNQAPNPECNFCAVMTCSSADVNCPHIPGAELRIALPFEDPGRSDKSANPETFYKESVHEIGRALLFAFSEIY